jgi:hypothetical protein
LLRDVLAVVPSHKRRVGIGLLHKVAIKPSINRGLNCRVDLLRAVFTPRQHFRHVGPLVHGLLLHLPLESGVSFLQGCPCSFGFRNRVNWLRLGLHRTLMRLQSTLVLR